MVDGYQISSGYFTPYLINSELGKNITIHPRIIVTDEEITSIQQLIPLVKSLTESGAKDVTIIAPGFAGEALLTLVRSHQGKALTISLIKIGGVREKQVEILQDIATVTGAEFISASLGKKMVNATIKDTGTAKKVECSKNDSVIIAPAGNPEEIKRRKEYLNTVMNDAKSEYEKEQIKERIARIDGSISVIYVGAHTEIEQKAKKSKLDDALNAARASIEEGIIPGGGATLIKIEKLLSDKEWDIKPSEDVMMGYVVVLNALSYPFKKILENAGIDRITIEGELGGIDEILMKTKCRQDDYGYDARNLCYCHLIEAGIIDPVRVTRSALQNACSAAGQLLTTEVIIIDEPDNTNLDVQQRDSN
jgi:chaperonin GroEL